MNWSGKKNKRLMLRVTEEMYRAVRVLAELEDIPIESTLRRLIGIGLDHSLGKKRKEKPGPMRQLASTDVSSRQQRDVA